MTLVINLIDMLMFNLFVVIVKKKYIYIFLFLQFFYLKKSFSAFLNIVASSNYL